MITIERLEDSEAAGWDAFVRAHESGSFFHLSGWQTVIERAFRQNTHFLMAKQAGNIVGILPMAHVKSRLFGNALISNGFSVGGSPLATSDAAYAALDRAAIDLLKETKAEYIEYRGPVRRHTDWACKDELYAGFSREIEAEEDANLKQIPRKQRAVVRKALKNESLDVRIDKDVDDFYALYALSVRNLGTPVFSKKLFTSFMEVFGEDCEILTITAGGVPVSSVMSFYYKDSVLPYYTGGSLEARRLGSNDLMYWHVMRRAVEKGKTIFDFGRSKKETGPYAFKKNWGFEPVPIVHEFYLPNGGDMPDVNPLNPKYRLMVETWKRLPLPVANFIGPLVVRNIG